MQVVLTAEVPMWLPLALAGVALAADRTITVTDKVELAAPIELAWIKLATAPGLLMIEHAEPLPDGEGRVLDVMGERVAALDHGEAGNFVVVAIDGPRQLRVRWQPDGDGPDWRVIDFALRMHADGTELEATVTYPLASGIARKVAEQELRDGLDAFKVSVDGFHAED